MKNFKIGGVPEHFNLPWYLTLKNKEYQDKNINLRWKDYQGGTGEMCNALRDGEIDMAVILTEGIVRDIIRHVQTMRKNANFAVEDRIKIYSLLEGTIGDAISSFETLFKNLCLKNS